MQFIDRKLAKMDLEKEIRLQNKKCKSLMNKIQKVVDSDNPDTTLLTALNQNYQSANKHLELLCSQRKKAARVEKEPIVEDTKTDYINCFVTPKELYDTWVKVDRIFGNISPKKWTGSYAANFNLSKSSGVL